jgi:2-polyprenyl-6-methoxyphenol hydroxylase-like FAD-dependent oxidoreductase
LKVIDASLCPHPTTQNPTPDTRHPSPFDVAIVGGGIGGSALGIVLARAGVRVAIVEREGRFRDRVRGEALMPWGATLAGELGIADALPAAGAHPLPIWQTYRDRDPQPPYDWRDDSPSGDGLWGINHPALQETLLRGAEEAGATVLRPAKALEPRRGRGGEVVLPVETSEGALEIRARLVVGADGSASGARRWIGAETIRDPICGALGGVLVEGSDLDPNASHVGFVPGRMALLFRQADGRARAYLYCQPGDAEALRDRGASKGIIQGCVAALPEGGLDGVRAVGPAAFFPAVDIFASRVSGDGIVLIGDAAGANDPAQGQGLSLALKDVSELSRRLLTMTDWGEAIADFADARPRWYEPLRAFAMWQGPLFIGVGASADAARERVERARERDPLRGGYALIHTAGPDGLSVDEEARRHFLGEDLA